MSTALCVVSACVFASEISLTFASDGLTIHAVRVANTTTVSLAFATAVALAAPAVFAQPAEDQRIVEARNLYIAATQANQARRYGEAVVAFERSNRLRPHPRTMYEIAAARRRAGDNEGALQMLRDALAMTDPAPNDELLGLIRTLAGELGEPNIAPTIQPTHTCPTCPTCPPERECPVCPPATPTDRPSWTPVLLGVGGGVALGLGMAFYGAAIGESVAYNNQNASIPLRMELKSIGETNRIIGLVGLIVGLGLEGTAIALTVTGRSRAAASATAPENRPAPRESARLRFDVTPNGLLVSGQF
jgi:tetratricopeptide (TPR) repeat protein